MDPVSSAGAVCALNGRTIPPAPNSFFKDWKYSSVCRPLALHIRVPGFKHQLSQAWRHILIAPATHSYIVNSRPAWDIRDLVSKKKGKEEEGEKRAVRERARGDKEGKKT